EDPRQHQPTVGEAATRREAEAGGGGTADVEGASLDRQARAPPSMPQPGSQLDILVPGSEDRVEAALGQGRVAVERRGGADSEDLAGVGDGGRRRAELALDRLESPVPADTGAVD